MALVSFKQDTFKKYYDTYLDPDRVDTSATPVEGCLYYLTGDKDGTVGNTETTLYLNGKLFSSDNPESIIVTKAAGNYDVDTTIDANTPIRDIIKNLLQQDVMPYVENAPSCSITYKTSPTWVKQYEIGDNFTPNYTATFNAGNYKVDGKGTQASGCTLSGWTVTLSKASGSTIATKTTASDTFAEQQFTDVNDQFKIKAVAAYGSGNVPLTFLGMKANDGDIPDKPAYHYSAAQIAAGSTEATLGTATCRRAWFYGWRSSKATIDYSDLTNFDVRTEYTTLATLSNNGQAFKALCSDATITSSKNLPNTNFSTGASSPGFIEMFIAAPTGYGYKGTDIVGKPSTHVFVKDTGTNLNAGTVYYLGTQVVPGANSFGTSGTTGAMTYDVWSIVCDSPASTGKHTYAIQWVR